MTVRWELVANRGQSFVGVGRGGCWRAHCQRIKRLVLMGINFVPAASLAPDKGTWCGPTHLGIFRKPMEHSSRGFHWGPSCAEQHTRPFSSAHCFFTLLHVHVLCPHFMGHTDLHPPPPALWSCLERNPLAHSKAAVPSSQTSSGQGEANVQIKQPTATPFTLIVTCLLRHAAVGGSFWHCLAAIWERKLRGGTKRRQRRYHGERQGEGQGGERSDELAGLWVWQTRGVNISSPWNGSFWKL